MRKSAGISSPSVCRSKRESISARLPLLGEVDRKLKELAQKRPALVEAFLAVYPTICAQAPERHRALHDPRDFPSVERVR